MEYVNGTEHQTPLVPKQIRTVKEKHIMHVDRCIMYADIKRVEKGLEPIKTMHRLCKAISTTYRSTRSTYNMLYRYKTGVAKPDHDFVELVRAYLDVDINDLYFVQ